MIREGFRFWVVLVRCRACKCVVTVGLSKVVVGSFRNGVTIMMMVVVVVVARC